MGVGYLPEHADEGPCTQIAIFVRSDVDREDILSRLQFAGAVPDKAKFGSAFSFEEAAVLSDCLRQEELVAAASGLVKYVMEEGSDDTPKPVVGSKVVIHYATYIGSSGLRVGTSRDGKRVEPCIFHMGKGKVIEAWHRAAGSMRVGEKAWVRSPPQFAFGQFGAPPTIPPRAELWFAMELMESKEPTEVKFFKDVSAALGEAQRHLMVGREELTHGRYGQARQAFRRARTACPEKRLLEQERALLERYVAMDRACLLNEALCAQRLAEHASMEEEPRRAAGYWDEVVRVCSLLVDRHLIVSDGGAAAMSCSLSGAGGEGDAAPGNMVELAAAIRSLSSASAAQWASKAFFRRAAARAQLQSLSDAIADLQASERLKPGDTEVRKLLEALQKRQQKVELKPQRMFAGLFEREQAEREKEEQAKVLEEKRRKREERLQKQSAAAG
eukprot:TRINITY_DN53138_c0_g2_i1.p1 TRINITY_DN53138_c0_g2~~TRINITY_DN53138_c0_g2_i1.p1  ORF type:complete len:444 (-),score=145.36 TRINITY_DN53138_c0_g2_i1:133-1464(-)